MSAALTLPYVWATVNEPAAETKRRLRPLGGLAFYRKRTEILLRRYMSVSMDMGRVPSVMGNLEFRGARIELPDKKFRGRSHFRYRCRAVPETPGWILTGTDRADSSAGVRTGRSRGADETKRTHGNS